MGTGYSLEELIAGRAHINNLNFGDATSAHALAEPVKTRLQFSGGVGNWRRWTVTSSADTPIIRLVEDCLKGWSSASGATYARV